MKTPMANGGRTDGKTTWGTPWDLFHELHERYDFTLDGAANKQNHKLPRWHGPGGDLESAFDSDWKNERVWLNPPYDDLYSWCSQIFTSKAELVAMLVPARTDTAWYHEWVTLGIEFDFAIVHFLEGRIRFLDETGKRSSKAGFASMLVVVHPSAIVMIEKEFQPMHTNGPGYEHPISVKRDWIKRISKSRMQHQSRLSMATDR